MIRHEVFDSSVQIDDLHHNSVYRHELNFAEAFVKSLPKTDTIDSVPCLWFGAI